MKQKTDPLISKHFSELGKRGAKKSWEVRKQKILTGKKSESKKVR